MLQQIKQPYYQLQITNDYPFKNQQLNRIFHLDPTCIVSLPSPPSPQHKILEIYNILQTKFQLLMQILAIDPIAEQQQDGSEQKGAKKAHQVKLHYQYVDTPLLLYVRRFVHEKIRIKMEMLCMEIRNLVTDFVTKGVNVLPTLSIKNIGVVLGPSYRQSYASQPFNKQIKMPKFKIYIDINKCQIISQKNMIARLMVETDKLIYNTLHAQIMQLVNQAEAEQTNFVLTMGNWMGNGAKIGVLDVEVLEFGVGFRKNKGEGEDAGKLDFTNHIKKKKKGIKHVEKEKEKEKVQAQNIQRPEQKQKCDNSVRKILSKSAVAIINEQQHRQSVDQGQNQRQRQSIDNISCRASPRNISRILDTSPQNLRTQISQIIENSRRTLQSFKKIFHNEHENSLVPSLNSSSTNFSQK